MFDQLYRLPQGPPHVVQLAPAAQPAQLVQKQRECMLRVRRALNQVVKLIVQMLTQGAPDLPELRDSTVVHPEVTTALKRVAVDLRYRHSRRRSPHVRENA